jgi:hypothetical protein
MFMLLVKINSLEMHLYSEFEPTTFWIETLCDDMKEKDVYVSMTVRRPLHYGTAE